MTEPDKSAELDLDKAAEYIGIKRSLLEKLIKNGLELQRHRSGRKFVVNKEDIDAWQQLRTERTVMLDKDDFVKAFRFAIDINYSGHTRADFSSSRQRSTTQAVENWTQGTLAEIALSKFIQQKFGIKLELEFRVFQNQIVGQDIVSVVRGRVANPPKKRISVKSGKSNGMLLIVGLAEVETDSRFSDYYVFVRIIYPDDFILRLFRDHPDLKSVKDKIPAVEPFKAEIIGYCLRSELEKVDTVPSASIDKPRYIKATGKLKNSDSDWKEFVDSL